jgi:hypothetical protein
MLCCFRCDDGDYVKALRQCTRGQVSSLPKLCCVAKDESQQKKPATGNSFSIIVITHAGSV